MRTWNLSLRIRDLERLVAAQAETIQAQANERIKLQESRDDWRLLAEQWEKMGQKLGKECDDYHTLLTYGSNDYKVERDRAEKALKEVLHQDWDLIGPKSLKTILDYFVNKRLRDGT